MKGTVQLQDKISQAGGEATRIWSMRDVILNTLIMNMAEHGCVDAFVLGQVDFKVSPVSRLKKKLFKRIMEQS